MIIHDTLQSAGAELPLVSLISPVYNTQEYLPIGIESIINQTYPNWELVFVDDGSTDKSVEIIRRYMISEPRIRLIQIENHGQGFARNMALKDVDGKYVMFFDSDDFLADDALDLAVTKLERENSDFVVFDWYYYTALGKKINYCNQDTFFTSKILVGEDCLSLLKCNPAFTQNKVYLREFLIDNVIKYGEGYIYEDMEFWVKAVLLAKRVSLIHSPLYRLTLNPNSSTKTQLDTDWHCSSFISAIGSTIDLIKQFSDRINDRGKYDLLMYFYEKFCYYYTCRTPNRYKKIFLKRFVDKMSCMEIVVDFGERRILSYFLKHKVFENRKYFFFESAFQFSVKFKPVVKSSLKKTKNILKKAQNKLKKIAAKFIKEPGNVNVWGIYKAELKRSIYDDVILFMGFDYRYTGNSRYLFEELIRKLPNRMNAFFVTDSPLVPAEYKIEPRSVRMYRFVARAKTIIFESWIPNEYSHRNGTTWIQLWHGTPLKRLMFDSNEMRITGNRPDNKIRKYNDILRWDYLLTDSPEIKSYFKTCFNISESKQIAFGYPRVKYIVEQKNNKKYIEFLKELYGISKNKKIVLYLPTWRDYNYGYGKAEPNEENEFDLSYLLDMKQLQSFLGENYEIIYKDHVFLSKPENVDFKNFSEAETQELLLMADYLITDYSSVMFDAMAIDLPVIIYCNDFEKNEIYRGVYEEMWETLSPFVCTDLAQIVNMIRTYKIDENYKCTKDKYSYKPSGGNLADFVLDKAQK